MHTASAVDRRAAQHSTQHQFVRSSDLDTLATTITLVNDSYRTARGGESALLLVLCRQCAQHLFLYQKDGPGPLLRCYVNRIHPRRSAAPGAHGQQSLDSHRCPHCDATYGHDITYIDGRAAIALSPGATGLVTLREETSDGSRRPTASERDDHGGGKADSTEHRL